MTLGLSGGKRAKRVYAEPFNPRVRDHPRDQGHAGSRATKAVRHSGMVRAHNGRADDCVGQLGLFAVLADDIAAPGARNLAGDKMISQ